MEDHHGSSRAYLQLFMDEATLYNRIVLGSLLPMKLWDPLPHFIQSWVRNCIGGTVIYFFSASLWCFYIYYLNRNLYFPTVDERYHGHYYFHPACKVSSGF
ncbi:delta(7)-sterol-c5(6)-desaturase 1 [Quercus suber]|uniref:Delta(7)-sterol-c5(6)-desaturase 1 n=1 Tax=Quercus suber TaxID=58331 RepID=A0AAW0KWR5_QUESU